MDVPEVGNLTVAQYDRLVMLRLPHIAWLTPIPVTVAAVPPRKGLACRLCIARLGFKASEFLPMTEEEHAGHLVEVHPELVAQCAR